jgi:Zn-dependent protease
MKKPKIDEMLLRLFSYLESVPMWVNITIVTIPLLAAWSSAIYFDHWAPYTAAAFYTIVTPLFGFDVLREIGVDSEELYFYAKSEPALMWAISTIAVIFMLTVVFSAVGLVGGLFIMIS